MKIYDHFEADQNRIVQAFDVDFATDQKGLRGLLHDKSAEEIQVFLDKQVALENYEAAAIVLKILNSRITKP